MLAQEAQTERVTNGKAAPDAVAMPARRCQRGTQWSEHKRCFLQNVDFWKPKAHGNRYYVAADQAGFIPLKFNGSVDLLVSDDGERWSWLSEIYLGDGIRPSETALCFLDDGSLLALARMNKYNMGENAYLPGHRMMCRSEPPYTEWTCHELDVLLQGFDIERVGPRIFVYDRASWKLEQYALLPKGLDTGYVHMVPVSDDEMIIIYYSSHEYPLTERPTGHDSVPSDRYIASVSFEPVA